MSRFNQTGPGVACPNGCGDPTPCPTCGYGQYDHLPCDGACRGTGILPGTALDDVRLGRDVDNIARCDACAHEDNFVRPLSYRGDYEAAKAVAAAAPGGGSWLVYAIDLDAALVATEEPQLYVRHGVADVASLQRDLLAQHADWIVVVEWVNGEDE